MHPYRSFAPPDRPSVMRMEWLDLAFLHWPVPPDAMRALVPAPLEVELMDGVAWLGIVPFHMAAIRHRGLPTVPPFAELNVRTYVRYGGLPGVWFFSLDATNRLAVRWARRFWRLNYLDARIVHLREGAGIWYRSDRSHRDAPPAALDVRYEPKGEPFEGGGLERWFAERYCLYTQDQRGRVLRGHIDHDPWPLERVEVAVGRNTMAKPLGLELAGVPVAPMFSRRLAVRGWTLERA